MAEINPLSFDNILEEELEEQMSIQKKPEKEYLNCDIDFKNKCNEKAIK